MKKIFLILVAILFLTGCSNVKEKSYDDIIAEAITTDYKYKNIYREGYKFYLPKGTKIISSIDSNDIISDNLYHYYLYVDRISYYNKIANDYIESSNAEYSKIYNLKDKSGYLEINSMQNDKYLIEIMYNYAKIEVIVDKDNVNRSIAYAITILSSIKFNDLVIANLVTSELAEFKEEEYNIFSTVNNDSNVLKFEETYSDEDYDSIPDTDLIN